MNSSVVTVNEDSYTDLFWAIRGGGGNFGIVTSFKFQAYPVKNVYGGPVFWPIERTGEIMEWFHDLIHDAPEDLNGFIATMVVPGPPFPEALHGRKVCGIVWCCTGDEELRSRLDENIAEKDPLFEHLGEMPYPAIQSLFDGFMPPGMQWYWKADFFKELGPEVRDIHRQYGNETPTPLSQMHLYPLSGAASGPGNDETAWANRDAKYAGVIVGVDPDPANAGLITDWCKEYWKALHPYSTGSAYSNFMMEEGEERIKATFGDNYLKLSRIKAKYDPENLFRVNQNIKPNHV